MVNSEIIILSDRVILNIIAENSYEFWDINSNKLKIFKRKVLRYHLRL